MTNMVGPSRKWAGSTRRLRQEKKGLELDPLNTLLNTDLGFFYNWARRYDEAIDATAQDIGVGCEQSLGPPRIGLVFTLERQVD